MRPISIDEHGTPDFSRGLARLFELTEKGRSVWKQEEFERILRHQLKAPLVIDLHALRGTDAPPDSDDRRVGCMDDLISHPNPPVALLRLIKDFAKTNRQRPDGPLPAEVASVLYYAVIVLARLRTGTRISRLSREQLREGIDWALDQAWLDAKLANLFEEADQRLRESEF